MGKLFVIDGTDGSGKQTQFKKLQERLNEENINLEDTISKANLEVNEVNNEGGAE